MENWGLVCFSGNKVTLEGLNIQLHWIQHRAVYVWSWTDSLRACFTAQSSSQDWWGPVYFSTALLVIHQVLSTSCSAFPEDTEFAVPMQLMIATMFKMYLNTVMFDVLSSVRKTLIPSAFSYLKLRIGIDSALIYIVSLLLFCNLLFFFLNNQALIQDIWLIKLRPSAAVLSPADLHCLKSVTFQGCSLTLSLPLSAVLLQICSFHPTYSDWALFTVMTIYDSHSTRQFVSKYRTCKSQLYNKLLYQRGNTMSQGNHSNPMKLFTKKNSSQFKYF